MWLAASIPSYEVEALVGLVSLENQGHGYVPHPVVGEAINPSHRAIFAQWVTVSVIIA
jgi:hypothetical protein